MTNPINTLVLGGYSAGKTHFGAQLLSRLHSRSCELELRGAAQNLSLFEGALARLADGMTSEHTPGHLYGSLRIPALSKHGVPMDLIWPEYGGEQLDKVMKERKMPPEWRDRVKESNHWVLMIRLLHTKRQDDLFNRPSTVEPETNDEGATPKSSSAAKWPNQALLIEFVQMLLFAHGSGVTRKLQSPRLLVLLSCWDEIPNSEAATPRETLKEYLPLFNSFLAANWEKESLLIYGLSSLSKSLKADDPDPEYQEKGPEAFGFVVLPDGNKDSDLTLPISRLANI
jgi:Double-GTPase 1